MFSDYQYPQALWKDIFYLENIIQSLLHEFGDEMTDLSDERLHQTLKEHLIKFESMISEHSLVDANFIEYFFRGEIMYISKFLKGLGNAANHPSFDLKQDLFLRCIGESAEFKTFISELSNIFEIDQNYRYDN
jgi:lysyl-tRNA synthetase class II